MYNPESILENEMHKILWDFEIQTDHLISARRSDLGIVKKNMPNCGLYLKVKLKESEKRDKYIDFAKELKKLWNMKVMVIPIVIGALETIPKWLVKELEDLEISRDNQYYSIIKIG